MALFCGMTVRTFVLFLLIAIAPALAGPPARIEVRGRVASRYAARPVNGAVVELQAPGAAAAVRARTRRDGSYTLRFDLDRFGDALGELTLRARADGFVSAERPLYPTTTIPLSPVLVNFELMPLTLNGILDIFSCCLFGWSILTTLVPAFFLGAAVKVFVPPRKSLRYLGPDAPKHVAYGGAIGAGMVLSLCSCNVVPLFLSILCIGAGTGPAFAFLFAGPAINVLSVGYSWRILGGAVVLWRVVAVILVSLTVGLAMDRLYPAPRRPAAPPAATPDAQAPLPRAASLLVALLVLLLVVGAARLPLALHVAAVCALTGLIVALALWRIRRKLVVTWLRETGSLGWKTVSVLLPAVVVLGLLAQWVPVDRLRTALSGNRLGVTGASAVFGSLMYFPILSETVFAKTLVILSGGAVGISPIMVLLLTAPGLSLPGMVVVGRQIGVRRVASYVAIIVLASIAVSLVIGSGVGQFLCACRLAH